MEVNAKTAMLRTTLYFMLVVLSGCCICHKPNIVYYEDCQKEVGLLVYGDTGVDTDQRQYDDSISYRVIIARPGVKKDRKLHIFTEYKQDENAHWVEHKVYGASEIICMQPKESYLIPFVVAKEGHDKPVSSLERIPKKWNALIREFSLEEGTELYKPMTAVLYNPRS